MGRPRLRPPPLQAGFFYSFVFFLKKKIKSLLRILRIELGQGFDVTVIEPAGSCPAEEVGIRGNSLCIYWSGYCHFNCYNLQLDYIYLLTKNCFFKKGEKKKINLEYLMWQNRNAI